MTTDNDMHLARCRDARTTALFRLDMIARGALLTYEDGSPSTWRQRRRDSKPRSPTWTDGSGRWKSGVT